MKYEETWWEQIPWVVRFALCLWSIIFAVIPFFAVVAVFFMGIGGVASL